LKSLVRSDLRGARELALKGLGLPVEEIARAFKEHPETRACVCGKDIAGILSTQTWAWMFPDVCEECEERALERQRRSAVEKARESMRRHIETILSHQGVPNRYLMATKECIKPEVWKPAWERTRDGGFLLTGGAGSGKTFLAVALMREWILTTELKPVISTGAVRRVIGVERMELPRFVMVPRLLMEIRGCYTGKGEGESEDALIRKHTSCPLLVLDDLGAEKTTEWSIQTLYTVINERYVQERPMIVTTNLGLERIEENFNRIADMAGSRLSSRLAGLGKALKLAGRDRRIS
jgi:DNA replication protein DnaC